METTTYECYLEANEMDRVPLDDLWYAVKEKILIELEVDEGFGYFIRQWKDIPIEYDDWDYKCKMEYWDLYLSDWKKIYDKWYGWWEDELKEWIEQCKRRINVL